MFPEKAKRKLEGWRAEYQEKAKYRLTLLEEVPQFHQEKAQLEPRLKAAMALTVMLSKATRDRSGARTAAEETITGLAALQRKVNELYAEEEQASYRAWKLLTAPMAKQTGAKLLKAAQRSCHLLVTTCHAGLLWDSNQKLQALAKLALEQGLSQAEVDRVFVCDRYKPDGRLGPELRIQVDEYLGVRKQLEPALAGLRTKTRWLDHGARGDYLTALTCHPSLVDFEGRWNVLVSFVVQGDGEVEVTAVFDDYFPLGIRAASEDELRRYFRRWYRLQERFLFIDRRFSQADVHDSIGAVMDKANKVPPTQLVPPPNHKWPNLEADKVIVKMKTCEPPQPPSSIADVLEPKLAAEMGRGPKRKRAMRFAGVTPGADSRWRQLRKRIEDRWEALKPVLLPNPQWKCNTQE